MSASSLPNNTRRLCLPAFVLAFVLALAAFPAGAQQRQEKRFPVTVRPIVLVQNIHGRIAVRSSQKLEVVVASSAASNRVEVDVDKVGNRIEVTAHRVSDSAQASEVVTDFEITVPEESELQIRTDSGLVVVERVFGDMTFDTVAADVQLSQVAGYLVVKTVQGSVTCRMCAGGRLEVSSISGNIRLLQPEASTIRAQTTTGNIYYDGPFLRGGSYFLKNYSGVIEVRFAQTDSFDLNATSLFGRVENEANLTPREHKTRVPARIGNSLTAAANEGHAKVTLNSFSGTIRIRKRE